MAKRKQFVALGKIRPMSFDEHIELLFIEIRELLKQDDREGLEKVIDDLEGQREALRCILVAADRADRAVWEKSQGYDAADQLKRMSVYFAKAAKLARKHKSPKHTSALR